LSPYKATEGTTTDLFLAAIAIGRSYCCGTDSPSDFAVVSGISNRGSGAEGVSSSAAGSDEGPFSAIL
jgi:hypothetical protein